MAYNNNSYSGYNRGYSGGGQSRPLQRSGYGAQQRPAYNQPLAEIQAERSRMTILTELTRSCAK